MEYRLVERAPSPAEYALLRAEVGWPAVDPGAVELGLSRALYSVCLESEDGEIAGCARVVGDGAIYFYVQDVVVRPDLQGRGLGARLMDAVMGYLTEACRPGSFVGLMAAVGVESFYVRYGFARRPEGRPGMYLTWPREQR